MKTTAQINIEKLTKIDRAILEEERLDLFRVRDSVRFLLHAYEGKLHTKLDRLELELADAIRAIDEVLGDRLELLQESDKLTSIVKSSV